MLGKIVFGANLLALSLALSGVQANAATVVSANLNVQIAISATCSLTGNTLNFGRVASNAGATSGSAIVKVNCTNGVAYAMAIGAGANDALGQKDMKQITGGGTALIPYTLSGFSGGATGTGAVPSVTINGTATIPATSPVDTYKDTVALTITY